MRLETEWLMERWETMTLIRRAEERIAEMVESGEVRCPCHLYIGQEAVAAGVCAALRPRHGLGRASLARPLSGEGRLAHGPVRRSAAESHGMRGGRGGSMHLAAPEVGILGTVPIVAGTIPLAAGAAFAYKMRGEDTVAVAFFGDGALEEGHVHESMNLAALYRLPLVLICENNLYASHLHWSERRVADNLDRAGEFHSVPGEQSGRQRRGGGACGRAVGGRAGADGDGPTLIECRTFRWRGHVGASFDLDVGVERRGELAEWLPRDPLRRLTDQLIERGVRNLTQREQAIGARIESAVEEARAAPPPELH